MKVPLVCKLLNRHISTKNRPILTQMQIRKSMTVTDQIFEIQDGGRPPF